MNGAAAGAGAGIAYSCDFRIAAENAKFIQAFIRVRLAPDSGNEFLPSKAGGGFAKALELSLTGDELTSKNAETPRVGLQSGSNRPIDDSHEGASC